MFYLVLKLSYIAFAPAPIDWQPLVTMQAVESGAVLAQEPGLVELLGRDMWFEASVKASVYLLQNYVNHRIVFGSSLPAAKSSVWWQETLRDDPAIAAASLAALSSRFIVWDVSQWPTSHETIVPDYRIILIEILFESYTHASRYASALDDRIKNMPPMDLTPPGGWPMRTDPSRIVDPDLREEYRRRLASAAEKDALIEELRRIRNVLGELEVVLADDVNILYRNALPAEVEQLVEIIVARGWDGSKLLQAIVADWDELGSLIGEAKTGTKGKADAD